MTVCRAQDGSRAQRINTCMGWAPLLIGGGHEKTTEEEIKARREMSMQIRRKGMQDAGAQSHRAQALAEHGVRY